MKTYQERVYELKKRLWKARDNYSKESTEANYKKVLRANQRLSDYILTGK